MHYITLISINNGLSYFIHVHVNPFTMTGFLDRGLTVEVNEVTIVPGGYKVSRDPTFLCLAELENCNHISETSSGKTLSVKKFKTMIDHLKSLTKETEEVIYDETIQVTDDSPKDKVPVGTLIVFSYQVEEPQRGLVTKRYASTYGNTDVEHVMNNFIDHPREDKFHTVREILGSSFQGYTLSHFMLDILPFTKDQSIKCVAANMYNENQLTYPTEALKLVEHLDTPLENRTPGLYMFELNLSDMSEKTPS